ncbi:hypothetical protein ACOSP7_005146 [Xanthoceras sorbifolium]
MIDPLVEEVFKQTNPAEPLEACLTHGATKKDENDRIDEYAFRFDSAAPMPYWVIKKLPSLISVKGVRSFLGRTGLLTSPR